MGFNVFEHDKTEFKLNDTYLVYIKWDIGSDYVDLTPYVTNVTIPVQKYNEEVQFFGNNSYKFLIPNYESIDDLQIELIESSELNASKIASRSLAYIFDYAKWQYVERNIPEIVIVATTNNFEYKIMKYRFKWCKLSNVSNYTLSYTDDSIPVISLSFSFMGFNQESCKQLVTSKVKDVPYHEGTVIIKDNIEFAQESSSPLKGNTTDIDVEESAPTIETQSGDTQSDKISTDEFYAPKAVRGEGKTDVSISQNESTTTNTVTNSETTPSTGVSQEESYAPKTVRNGETSQTDGISTNEDAVAAKNAANPQYIGHIGDVQVWSNGQMIDTKNQRLAYEAEQEANVQQSRSPEIGSNGTNETGGSSAAVAASAAKAKAESEQESEQNTYKITGTTFVTMGTNMDVQTKIFQEYSNGGRTEITDKVAQYYATTEQTGSRSASFGSNGTSSTDNRSPTAEEAAAEGNAYSASQAAYAAAKAKADAIEAENKAKALEVEAAERNKGSRSPEPPVNKISVSSNGPSQAEDDEAFSKNGANR